MISDKDKQEADAFIRENENGGGVPLNTSAVGDDVRRLKTIQRVANFLERLGDYCILDIGYKRRPGLFDRAHPTFSKWRLTLDANEYHDLREELNAILLASPLPLLPPVKTESPSPSPVSCALLLEVWKNQAGWNWHMKAPGWVLFNSTDCRFRSRSDAQHAGERAAAQLNITITEIKVR